MRKVILFGTGNIGRRAIEYLGADAVECYCDNNIQKVGTIVNGKKVISFDELKEKHSGDCVLVSTTQGFANTIEAQLESNGIKWYIWYPALEYWMDDKASKEEFFEKWTDLDKIDELKIRVEANVEIHRLKQQVEFFKKHVDITTLKPATGELRKNQMSVLQLTKRFINKCEEFGIAPFLCGGNLIGAVRHKGFVPWDDDMDLVLMRKDILTLFEYFDSNNRLYIGETESDYVISNYRRLLEASNGELIIVRNVGQIKVIGYDDDNEVVQIDVWPFDYICDDVSLEDYGRWIKEVDKEIKIYKTIKEKLDLIDTKRKGYKGISIEKTGKVYSGPDNWCARMYLSKKEEFVKTEHIFPLKKMEYEGEQLAVPADCHMWLQSEYKDYMQFPDDVGIETHGC